MIIVQFARLQKSPNTILTQSQHRPHNRHADPPPATRHALDYRNSPSTDHRRFQTQTSDCFCLVLILRKNLLIFYGRGCMVRNMLKLFLIYNFYIGPNVKRPKLKPSVDSDKLTIAHRNLRKEYR